VEGGRLPGPGSDADRRRDLAAGTYTGVITVTSSVGIARRTLELTAPEAAPTPAAARSLSDTTELTAQRDGPGHDATLDDGGLLLLKRATRGTKLGIPRCKDDKCPLVGNLVDGTHVASVFVAGLLNTYRNQPWELPLRIEGADEVGAYTGTIDLAQTPADAADDIKLSVTVKDALWCALVALAIGSLISFLSQYALRTSVPKKRLRNRYRAFAADYKTAVDTFNANRPKKDELSNWSAPSQKSVDEISNAIEEGIKRYRSSTVYWDAASDAFKELDGSLALVEDDIACLKDPERLATRLTAAGVAELVRREAASDTRLGSESAEFDARVGARPRSPAGRAVDDAEQRPDRELEAGGQPGALLLPAPGVHADLAAATALAVAHEQ
jgi:hypothetical protein